jgi:hypothetical protein
MDGSARRAPHSSGPEQGVRGVALNRPDLRATLEPYTQLDERRIAGTANPGTFPKADGAQSPQEYEKRQGRRQRAVRGRAAPARAYLTSPMKGAPLWVGTAASS